MTSKTVNTVMGKIPVDDLGRTLVHEHLLIGYPGWFMDARQPPFRREDALSRVVDAFQRLRDYGVRSVLDPCPMDLGRDVTFCAEVARRTGLNLICTTGVNTEAKGLTHTLRDLDTEAIAEIFVREIEDGVGDTGIRVGAIKIATGEGCVSLYERKMVVAAARAARITGVAILSHTEKCTCGHDQIDLILGEGLEASRLIVGHSDGTDDHAYQKSLAARGAFVGFDRFGLEMFVPDTVRVKNLKLLAESGHKDRIMVSQDSVGCFLGAPPLSEVKLKEVAPNWSVTHLFENIFPQLRESGMTDTELNALLIDNPRCWLGSETP